MIEYANVKRGVCMLEYIIEHFRINSQFINDFDGLDEYLSSLDISMEERNLVLREVFEYNNKIYSILFEENKKLERIIALRQSSRVIQPNPVVRKIKTDPQAVTPMNVDVNVYLERIKECASLEDIASVLPDKNSENFYHIVYTILLNLYEEVMGIKKLLYQERNNSDKETQQYFMNEVEQLMFKIQYIKGLIKVDDKSVETTKSENELVFLKTNYGNVCALSDIKDIAMEYYDQFYELLESICDGSFKNFKPLVGNSSIRGLCEVKGDQTRIVFDRISNNVYVIIYIFVKKVDRSASYQAALQNRGDLYKASYEEIKSLLETSDEYLEENRKIKEKLYRMLTKENKVKKLGEMYE